MSRRKKNAFWKNQKQVRKELKLINSQLKEDCFAGRFEVKQIGRKDFQSGNYINYNPANLKIDQVADPCYRHSFYLLELIDNEMPERNVKYWAEWSNTFGIHSLEKFDWSSPKDYRNSGLSNLEFTMNNFIVNSDFWEKWKSLEYAKTHWYSGKALADMINYGGEQWRSAEELAKNRPERFK